jgi:hypothetical protein
LELPREGMNDSDSMNRGDLATLDGLSRDTESFRMDLNGCDRDSSKMEALVVQKNEKEASN